MELVVAELALEGLARFGGVFAHAVTDCQLGGLAIVCVTVRICYLDCSVWSVIYPCCRYCCVVW